jgi:hypothetical protein
METLLGAGGMGKVYKVFDKVLSLTVALQPASAARTRHGSNGHPAF